MKHTYVYLHGGQMIILEGGIKGVETLAHAPTLYRIDTETDYCLVDSKELRFVTVVP